MSKHEFIEQVGAVQAIADYCHKSPEEILNIVRNANVEMLSIENWNPGPPRKFKYYCDNCNKEDLSTFLKLIKEENDFPKNVLSLAIFCSDECRKEYEMAHPGEFKIGGK